MESLRGTRRTYPFSRAWSTVSALLLASAGCLDSLSWAQSNSSTGSNTCETTRTTTSIRIESSESSIGVDALRAEANCANRGKLEAEWAGVAVRIDTPIAIASGTFLTITGDDALAEVQGGSLTRLFEVSPGGSLTLTQLKLSGGAAENGGAIRSESANLTLDACVFDGNAATDGDGGAVWADGGTVTIVGGEFLGNSATVSGGAVLATGASLVVKDGARFENNRATVGGALYCIGQVIQEQQAGSGLATAGSGPPSCSITDAEFVSNSVARRSQTEDDSYLETGGAGGAAAFLHANVSVTRSVFSANSARRSGGGLFGGDSTDMRVMECTFENNTSESDGGAVMASSATLGGGTRLIRNSASSDGGAVFGWDAEGTVVFNDVVCSLNSAGKNGGCFHAEGTGTATNGTVMHNNHADQGGCIYAYIGSDISIDGGDFMCQSAERGGFIFVGDDVRLKITGGMFANNLSTRRAGVVYCNGDGVSTITIEGGTFRDNRALEFGGAIVAWGVKTVVNVTGGDFFNNTAKFYGGFIFLEEGASLVCQGANITGNFAGDQGGGIYAREATWVNSSCDLVASESPQGAAIYLTNVKGATFENHTVTDNLASGGSVVFVAASSVVARDVKFESGIGLQEDSSNRAIQLDGRSTLTAERCVFDGWLGDTVIHHTNSANRSLVLDSCDFRGSSAAMAVISPQSDAEIRNAVVGGRMVASAVASTPNNASLALVDRALGCSDGDDNLCGRGGCANSLLGVLCECLEGGQCLDGGGELSLRLKTRPDNVTYSPDPVSYELLVSAAEDGTTNALWKLEYEADGLDLRVVPPSGVLPPGGNVTVAVTGTPSTQDVGGTMTSRFVLTSVSNAAAGSSESAGGVQLEVSSMFYLCFAYAYAKPLPLGGDDDSDDDGGGGGSGGGGGGEISCEQCATIEGGAGVDCDSPGATLASLPIKEGFWRASLESLTIHECLHSEACAGATTVSSSDDYCAEGYEGPYCAVCSEGYGRGVSISCHYCNDAKARLLITAGAVFSLLLLMLLALAVVFLVGGLDAIDSVRQTFNQKLLLGKSSASNFFAPESSLQGRPLPRLGPRIDSLDTTIAPAYDFPVEDSRYAAAAAAAAGGGWGSSGITRHKRRSSASRRRIRPSIYSEPDDEVLADVDESEVAPDGGVEGDVDVSEYLAAYGGPPADTEAPGTPGGYAAEDVGVSGRRHARPSAVADAGTGEGVGVDPYPSESGAPVTSTGAGVGVGAGVGGGAAVRGEEGGAEAGEGGRGKCCGFGDKVKRFLSRLPLDKLKILVVVWQILTVFSSIAGVEFPASYSAFLSWINFVNLDIGNIFSASCLLPTANFYVRLLVTTLSPLVLAAVLVLTHHFAKGRAGIGRAGVLARRAAWSRHVAAWLLLTFLVFTSASTVTFKTFACDHDAVEGESYLRADYSISCTSSTHTFFKVYAGFMILVYPIGIPALYASILWKNRELLNPRVQGGAKPGPDGLDGTATNGDWGDDNSPPAETLGAGSKRSKGQTKNAYSREELEKLEELVKARRELPELVPSMFLWKDFGPDLYYYEVVECGRRMLLTGVLIFIAPQSPTQTSTACIFAFASLLGFELMRPHLDPADAWLYRMGCVVIFLSNFLALLIKVDAAGEENRAAFAGVLVLVNVLLVLAVLITSWFATQQSVDDSREEENAFTLAKTMLTAEQHAATSARLTRASGNRGVLPSTSLSARPDTPPGGGAAPGELGAPPSSRLRRGGAVSEDVAPTYERATGGLSAPPSRRPHRRVSTSEGAVSTYVRSAGGGLFAPPSRRLGRDGGATSEDAIPTYERTPGGLLAPSPQRRGASGVTTSEYTIPSYERATGGLDGAPLPHRLQLGDARGVSTSEDVAVPTYERSGGGLFAPPSRRLRRDGGATSEDAIPTYERTAGGLLARSPQRGGVISVATSQDAVPTDRRAAGGLDGVPPSHRLQLGDARGVSTSEDVVPTYKRSGGGIFAPPSRRLQRGGATSEDAIPTYERTARGLLAPSPPRGGAIVLATSQDAVPIDGREAGSLGVPPPRRLQLGGIIGVSTSEDVVPTYERSAGGPFAPQPHSLQRGGARSEDTMSTFEPTAGGLFAPPSRTLLRGGAIGQGTMRTYERAAGGLGAPPSGRLQLGGAVGATTSGDAMPTYERPTGGLFAPPSRRLQRGDAISEDAIPTYERAAGGLGAPPARRLQLDGTRGVSTSEDAVPTYKRSAGGLIAPSTRRPLRGGAIGAAKSEDAILTHGRQAGSVEVPAVERLRQPGDTRGVPWHG